MALNLYLDDNQQVLPDFSIAKTTPCAPAGYDQDNLHWTDLATFASGGHGGSALFNALPLYVSQKALWQYAEDSTALVNGRNVFHCPTAFVFSSDVRANSGEVPFYGANPLHDLAAPRGWLNHLSSGHAGGANLTFLDGHASYYKYFYLCFPNGTKIGDPTRPDINCSCDGTPRARALTEKM